MNRTASTRVVCCLDGLDPAYLAAAETPEWDRIAATDTTGECRGAVPSPTNVNNVGIVAGTHPGEHGITGNTYFDREAGEQVYMEEPSFLRCETRFERYADRGEAVAAVVAKEKLERFVGQGCAITASAQSPPDWLVDAVGEPPGIYSGQASRWVLDAALHLLDSCDPDVLYVSTTDVIPHKHEPGSLEANAWVGALDERLGSLAARDVTLCATADHGMNRKTRCVDLDRVLAAEGLSGEVIALIRDRHTYHHQNLGGAAYVYLGTLTDASATTGDAEGTGADTGDAAALADRLEGISGVDLALSAAAAAERFALLPDRIGDLLVLGDRETVFGSLEDGGTGNDRAADTYGNVDLRSHGSHHERTVPYVSNREIDLAYNAAAFAALDEGE